MEQKNAAAAVGGEGKDYCSNLVFTKKNRDPWAPIEKIALLGPIMLCFGLKCFVCFLIVLYGIA